MKSLVAEICASKRAKRICPALATEMELKQGLSRRGISYTAESFRAMLSNLEVQPDVIVHRLLRYNGYEINEEYDKDNTCSDSFCTGVRFAWNEHNGDNNNA